MDAASTDRKLDLRKMPPSGQGSLVDGVYAELLEAIVSGRVPTGAILSEVLVAKQLDVSRTPVHDALRQLAKDGYVERRNGRRARVMGFTADDVYELFEMRKVLEGAAAERAAIRMDVRQLAPLRESLLPFQAGGMNGELSARWSECDAMFHAAIAEASGLRRLVREIDRYRLLHRAVERLGRDEPAIGHAIDEHQAILSALEAHDAARARRTMEEHLTNRQRYYAQKVRRGA